MTQPPNEQPPSVMRFGDLKKMVSDMVAAATSAGSAIGKEITGGNDTPRQPLRDQVRGARQTPQRSVDEEVAAALKKIEDDKARQAREEARDKDINDLKERTKEKTPVERSRLHKFMGWGE